MKGSSFATLYTYTLTGQKSEKGRVMEISKWLFFIFFERGMTWHLSVTQSLTGQRYFENIPYDNTQLAERMRNRLRGSKGYFSCS